MGDSCFKKFLCHFQKNQTKTKASKQTKNRKKLPLILWDWITFHFIFTLCRLLKYFPGKCVMLYIWFLCICLSFVTFGKQGADNWMTLRKIGCTIILTHCICLVLNVTHHSQSQAIYHIQKKHTRFTPDLTQNINKMNVNTEIKNCLCVSGAIKCITTFTNCFGLCAICTPWIFP